jgi:hypothetical protein
MGNRSAFYIGSQKKQRWRFSSPVGVRGEYDVVILFISKIILRQHPDPKPTGLHFHEIKIAEMTCGTYIYRNCFGWYYYQQGKMFFFYEVDIIKFKNS